MNLYLVTRTTAIGYDEYDEAVIAALSEYNARHTDPSPHSFWCEPYDLLTVELIGVAKEGTVEGVILNSFNAG